MNKLQGSSVINVFSSKVIIEGLCRTTLTTVARCLHFVEMENNSSDLEQFYLMEIFVGSLMNVLWRNENEPKGKGQE
jgi:hypothetical protein